MDQTSIPDLHLESDLLFKDRYDLGLPNRKIFLSRLHVVLFLFVFTSFSGKTLDSIDWSVSMVASAQLQSSRVDLSWREKKRNLKNEFTFIS